MTRRLLAAAVLLCGSIGLAVYALDTDCAAPDSCVDEIKPGAINLPDHQGAAWQPTSDEPPNKPEPPELLTDDPRPELIGIARVSPKEAWGILSDAIQRWDGRKWQATPIPHIPLPKTPKGHEASLKLRGITATSRGPVWAVGDIESWICCMAFNHHDTVVLRWNGTAWQRQDLHLRGTQLTSVASDGRGGAWVATDRRYLLHSDPQGRWTKVALPLPSDGRWWVTRLSNEPGTTAVWAAAADDSNGGVPARAFRLG